MKPMKLQRGPKSYSYLPFVEALTLFGANNTTHSDTEDGDEAGGPDGNNDVADDLDAFLNACDAESDDEDESFDCYNNPALESMLGAKAADKSSRIKDDVSAVTMLISALEDAREERTANELVLNNKNIGVQEQYCRVLIQSEIQTLSFFIAISRTVKQQLDNLIASASATTPQPSYILRNDTDDISTRYIADVANAFVAIRYSSCM